MKPPRVNMEGHIKLCRTDQLMRAFTFISVEEELNLDINT